MAHKVAFIHTINGLVPTFERLCRELLPEAKVSHISDDTLIQAVLAAGGLRPEIYRRVCEHVVAAELSGAEAIQLTCSSVSPCVDVARYLVSAPVLKIDEPMVEEAVAAYEKIGVIATAPTTLKPTSELLREKAALCGRRVEIIPVLCEGAYDALFQGDTDRHDRIVVDYLKDIIKRVEVVLLAQASIARVVETLERKETTVPIISSPRPAVQRLARLLSAR